VGTVHHNLVLVLLLYGVHTTCGCSGAAEHGHNGGLCIVFTFAWRVANFGSATLSRCPCPKRLALEEFGTAAMKLKTDGAQQTLTREPSDRQSMHWIPWPQVRDTLFRVLTQAQQLYHSDNLHRKAAKEWKQLQKAVQLALYVLIPPLRNNFARLRFVTDENAQDLARTKSPNYIFVAANGKMTLVMNQYKNDQRSTVETYDPEQDFALNTERTRRFDLAAPDAVLQKFGFSPQHLQNYLQVYRSAVQQIHGEANPDQFVFFGANGTPHSPDTMARRMGRMTKRLFGTTLQSQMMRTLFVSWFDSQRPTMPERKHIARWMLQTVETQMGTYSKRDPVSQAHGGGKKRRMLTVQELCS
jgi:hypothetical protein